MYLFEANKALKFQHTGEGGLWKLPRIYICSSICYRFWNSLESWDPCSRCSHLFPALPISMFRNAVAHIFWNGIPSCLYCAWLQDLWEIVLLRDTAQYKQHRTGSDHIQERWPLVYSYREHAVMDDQHSKTLCIDTLVVIFKILPLIFSKMSQNCFLIYQLVLKIDKLCPELIYEYEYLPVWISVKPCLPLLIIRPSLSCVWFKSLTTNGV